MCLRCYSLLKKIQDLRDPHQLLGAASIHPNDNSLSGCLHPACGNKPAFPTSPHQCWEAAAGGDEAEDRRLLLGPDITQAENNQSHHMTKQVSYMHLKYVQTERFLLPLLLLSPFLLQTDNCKQIMYQTNKLMMKPAEKIWLMNHSADA